MQKRIAIALNSLDLLKHALFKGYEFPASLASINRTQERILMTVRNTDQLPMVTVARAIGLEKGPFSQTVDKLEHLGLLIRVKLVGDKRSITLALTDKGVLLAESIEEAMEAHFKVRLSVLNIHELQQFFDALSILQKTAQILNSK